MISEYWLFSTMSGGVSTPPGPSFGSLPFSQATVGAATSRWSSSRRYPDLTEKVDGSDTLTGHPGTTWPSGSQAWT